MQSMASPPAASNKALAVLLVCLDRQSEAEAALARFHERNPDFSLQDEAQGLPVNWQPEGTADRWLDSLRQAGLN